MNFSIYLNRKDVRILYRILTICAYFIILPFLAIVCIGELATKIIFSIMKMGTLPLYWYIKIKGIDKGN